jgi:hypothetical protein
MKPAADEVDRWNLLTDIQGGRARLEAVLHVRRWTRLHPHSTAGGCHDFHYDKALRAWAR